MTDYIMFHRTDYPIDDDHPYELAVKRGTFYFAIGMDATEALALYRELLEQQGGIVNMTHGDLGLPEPPPVDILF